MLNNNNCFSDDKIILLYLPFDNDCNSHIPNEKSHTKGSLLFNVGKVGNALLIGGAEKALVEFSGEKYFDPKQGTIAFWVKPVDWDSSKEPNAQAFYFFNLSNAFLYRVWKDSVTFYCRFPDYKVYRLYNAGLPLRQGEWSHIALSWLDNILKIYDNGELAGQFMLWEPMRREWQGNKIGIGEPSSKKHSLIDDFYIFDYPLSASEIKQIYETSSKGTPAQFPDYKPFRVYVTFYPASNKAFICLDGKHAAFSSPPVAAKLFLVNSEGQNVPLANVTKLELPTKRTVKLVDLPKNMTAGHYSISARILDAKGEELVLAQSESFEKRIYPWEHASIGSSDEVIPPFTPLKIQNNVICWGREYLFKEDGFPKTIVTRKAQILSEPITMEAYINGAHLNLGEKLEVITQKPGVILLHSSSKHDCGQMDVSCRVEYDGMLLYNIKFIPNKEVTLDKLLIKLPLKNSNAKLYHVCRDAIRNNSESDYLPKGAGKIWGSSAKKSKNVLGTFIPYFWIGDYDRGFCWMADNDKNWSVPDNEDCVEFIRDEKALTAIVNFIKSKKTISKPWEVTFALMAGPPRPEPPGWRLDGSSKRWSSWFSAGVETLQGFGKPPNFEKYLMAVKKYKKLWGYWGVNTSPNDFWGKTEENKYFQLEWSGGTAWDSLGYPLLQRNNFVMYTLNQLMSKGYVDGLYSDDTFPMPSTNLITGAGYIRNDGKIQAGYSMFALRDFFKRSAYLFRKHNCSRSMMVHMTDAMMMPCYSFWDIKNDNEWGKVKPGKIDFIDAFSLGEICARSMSRQYGMAAVWHTPADRKNSPNDGDDLACLLLLHDIIGRTTNIGKRTSPGKSLFGIGEPDVEFLGYWVLQPNNDPEKKDVKISAWVRKKLGTALVVVANLSQQDWEGKLALPLKVMGLNSDDVALDAEGKHETLLNFKNGELNLSIPRHNYRFLLIGPKGKFTLTASASETKLEKPKVNMPTPSEARPSSKVKIGPPIFLKKVGEGAK